MEETLAEIEAQIDVAARGVSTHVTDRQTATGVKDNISQHWIKLLLERGGDLHARYLTNPETRDRRLNDKKLTRVARTIVRGEIETKILTEQREWLARQPQSSHRLQALLEKDNAGGKTINDTFNRGKGNLPSEYVELPIALRPGDHYNALFGFDGTLLPSSCLRSR